MKETPFGKYLLVGRLGGGGMAEVFHARLTGPSGFSKDVALKLILPQFSDEPEFVKMFIHEATLAARLDHANIVRIYEFDKIEGRYAIAMELVDGKDLRQVFARAQELDRRIAIPEALAIAYHVCQGLAFAHGELAEGAVPVVHRDISPHNIILSKAGEVKITDFGIAKLASASGFTRTGVIKGKVSYMSPEQARGEPVDTLSDLFSLACVLWEMLTGQRLFVGDSDLAVLERVKQAQVPPPSAFRREVPPELDQILLKALQHDPAQRFPGATTLGTELDKLLSRCSDVNRVTLLVKLFRDLFSGTERHEGTPLLQLPEELPKTNAPAAPSLLLAQTLIEPVGPDAATRIEEVSPAPRRSNLSRWTPRFLAVVALVSSVALGVWWSWRSSSTTPSVGEEEPRVAALDGGGNGVVDAQPSPRLTGALQGGTSSPSDEPFHTDGGELRAAEEQAPALDGGDLGARDAGPPVIAQPVKPRDGGSSPAERAPDGPVAKKPPTSSPGLLNLNAIPWARVYHGKRFLGETPIEGLSLPPGDYVLWLEAADPRMSRKIQIRIQSHKTTQKVVDLRP
ncbi:MAG: protein kinase [Myxococcales bacterium]|nr:protein kinase [Myxococcales bacterium]